MQAIQVHTMFNKGTITIVINKKKTPNYKIAVVLNFELNKMFNNYFLQGFHDR